jgi:hypothetical protein
LGVRVPPDAPDRTPLHLRIKTLANVIPKALKCGFGLVSDSQLVLTGRCFPSSEISFPLSFALPGDMLSKVEGYEQYWS